METADSGSGAGRVALVTGATGGIGGAIARALARAGARVVLTGRDPERAAACARDVEEDTGTRCLGLPLDVTKGDSVERLVEILAGRRAGRRDGGAGGVAENLGPIDWLVNNAGVAETASATGGDNHALTRRLMEINLFGALRLFEAFVPGMLERGRGSVLQIASSAALRGYPYVSAYAASKHALLGWTRSAALECAPKGIGVSAICPHYVDTPLTDRSITTMREKTGRSEEDLRAFIASQNPGGVMVTPEEVAALVLELLTGDRGGVVVELPGGQRRTLEEGVAIAARTESC